MSSWRQAAAPVLEVEQEVRGTHGHRELTAEAAPAESCHDFDLHGLAGIRLHGATTREIETVRRQLGPIDGPLGRDPDLVLRFVDRLEDHSGMWLLGSGDVGFTEEGFYVLRSKHKEPCRVRIPFESIGGGPFEITCERGLPAVPLLVPIVNLTVLARGGLPLHAAALEYHETGVLVTGWSKGGKTETLLGFARKGARYVGDEWVYLTDGGRWMHGIPEPIRIWDWHLDEVRDLRRQLGPRSRARLLALRLASRWLEAIAGVDGPAFRAWRSLARRLSHLVTGQRYVDLRPERLFPGSSRPAGVTVDRVLLVVSHGAPGVEVTPIDFREVADRMVASLQEERAILRSCYQKFRFARPNRVNGLLEVAHRIERERLRLFLRDRPCYLVRHPYPPSPTALYEAIRPVLEA